MHRFLALLTILGAAAVATGPAAAALPAWKGVVVAKDPRRSAVVTASPSGLVRTLRVAPARLSAVAVGQRLDVRAGRLADGTFRAASVRTVGSATAARVRGVLVRFERKRSRYLVSAGGSVLELALVRGTRSLASAHEPQAGDRVDASVTVEPGGAVATTGVETTGRVGALELEGIVTEIGSRSLTLVVARAGFVSVAVPEGVTLPASLRAFDAAQLVVAVGTTGSFTLLAVQTGKGEGKGDAGVDYDEDGEELEVKGTISALDAASVTVQPGNGASPATCAVEGAELTGFAVGDKVEMECEARADRTFVLVELESKRARLERSTSKQGDDEPDDDEDGDDETDDGDTDDTDDTADSDTKDADDE